MYASLPNGSQSRTPIWYRDPYNNTFIRGGLHPKHPEVCSRTSAGRHTLFPKKLKSFTLSQSVKIFNFPRNDGRWKKEEGRGQKYENDNENENSLTFNL